MMPTVPATPVTVMDAAVKPSKGNLLMAAAIQRKSAPKPASGGPNPTAPKALNRAQKAMK